MSCEEGRYQEALGWCLATVTTLASCMGEQQLVLFRKYSLHLKISVFDLSKYECIYVDMYILFWTHLKHYFGTKGVGDRSSNCPY